LDVRHSLKKAKDLVKNFKSKIAKLEYDWGIHNNYHVNISKARLKKCLGA
jgi:hypothetical protein